MGTDHLVSPLTIALRNTRSESAPRRHLPRHSAPIVNAISERVGRCICNERLHTIRAILLMLGLSLSAPIASALSILKVSGAVSVYFDANSAALEKSQRYKLDVLACKLANLQLEAVIAVGHGGPKERSVAALSRQRVERIKQHLVSIGVPHERIHTESKGSKEQIANSRVPVENSRNLRVEIEYVGNPYAKSRSEEFRRCDPFEEAIRTGDLDALRQRLSLVYRNAPYAERITSPYLLAATPNDFKRLPSMFPNPAPHLISIGRFDLAATLWSKGLQFDKQSVGAEVASLVCSDRYADLDTANKLNTLLGLSASVAEARGHGDPFRCAIRLKKITSLNFLAARLGAHKLSPAVRPALLIETAGWASSNLELLERFAAIGLDPAATNERGQSLYHRVNNLTPELVEWFKTHGVDAATADKNGVTPLMVAASTAMPSVLTEVLKKAAVTTARDASGFSALSYAIRASKDDNAILLLDSGADPSVISADGSTLLHHSASGSLELLRKLINSGIDVQATNLRGETALHLAAASPVWQPPSPPYGAKNTWSIPQKARVDFMVNRKTETLELLIAYGSRLDAIDADGKTPFQRLPAWEQALSQYRSILGAP